MYSPFCLQGPQLSSLPAIYPTTTLCQAPCWVLDPHDSLVHPISLNGPVSTSCTQGNLGSKVRKSVQGSSDLPGSAGLLRTVPPTRCPGQGPGPPKAGKGSFLDFSIIPMSPARLQSVWEGHRWFFVGGTKSKSGSLLWAQGLRGALAPK